MSNPPAFPIVTESQSVEGTPVHLTFTNEGGMTLRDYFAAAALMVLDVQAHVAPPAAEYLARSGIQYR